MVLVRLFAGSVCFPSIVNKAPEVSPSPHRPANNLAPHPACDWCRGCIVGMCMALAGCASAPRLSEPLNLSDAKAAVSRYLDSGAYEQDQSRVVAEASAWLRKRAAAARPGEQLAIVLDVDETAISNAPLIRRLDFAYIPSEWSRWVESSEAPAITPVRELFREARSLGLAVYFVTTRKDPADRHATEENLRRQGMSDYASLIMARPEDKDLTITQRKSKARASIEAQGLVIIANLGDQESDLRGGHAERSFRLPNPFYLME